MKELIQKHVLNGEFESVYRLMSQTDFMEFEEAYISSAHEVESIMFYTCILDMMKTEETAEMHDLAFLLLVYPLSELQGALDSAYYHAESSIKLTDGKEVKAYYRCCYYMQFLNQSFLIKSIRDFSSNT